MRTFQMIALSAVLLVGSGVAATAGRNADRGFDWNLEERNWDLLGEQAFGYRYDDKTIDSVRSRDVRAIGIRASGGDASCRLVLVRFGNGQRVSLDASNLDYMRDGKLYKIDVPGNRRDIRRLAVSCRAETGRLVDLLFYLKR